ncbi:MAG: hypothetical protein ACP5JE_03865, partial [Thermoplasmata archaeon]
VSPPQLTNPNSSEIGPIEVQLVVRYLMILKWKRIESSGQINKIIIEINAKNVGNEKVYSETININQT